VVFHQLHEIAAFQVVFRQVPGQQHIQDCSTLRVGLGQWVQQKLSKLQWQAGRAPCFAKRSWDLGTNTRRLCCEQ
jgi:hypothetical protein